MAKTIAVTNQKGGVGKTTTCINLCAALVNIGRKVLIVDLDPQGNATVGCGVMKNEFIAGSYDVLLGEANIGDAIEKTETGIDILAANDDLAGAQIEMLELPDREVRLKALLMQVEGNYDYIFIDCPPSLNILTINALAAAKSVLIPIQCEYYALEGLSALISTVDKIKYTLNPGLKIEGLLRTMYDGRNTLSIEVSQQLIEHFPGKVYKTFIPRNVRVAEAPGYGVSVIEYDRTSKGATAYLNLAGEFLIRQNRLDEDEIEETQEDVNEVEIEIEEQPDFTSELAATATGQSAANEVQAQSESVKSQNPQEPADTQQHQAGTEQPKNSTSNLQSSEEQNMAANEAATNEQIQDNQEQQQLAQNNREEKFQHDQQSEQATESELPEQQDEPKPLTSTSI